MNIHPICELNGDPTLCKDRFTRIKYGMLYVKPKVQLFKAKIMVNHLN